MKRYYPVTIQEARKRIYGQWAGFPKGSKYKEGICAYPVQSKFRPGGYQCSKKARYGTENLYCKVHARVLGMLEPEV